MTYSANLSNEVIKQRFLAVLKPRRKITSWTLFSGLVYETDFDYGQVVEMTENGTSLTLGSSTTLNSGEFYFDTDTSKLYIRTTGDTDPTTEFVVGVYELYQATLDTHFNRDPLDDGTRVVYYEPTITVSPNFKQTIKNQLFGFLPSQTSSIEINNSEHFLEKHIYDGSFNRGEVKIYHVLGDVQTDNIKLVFDGLMQNVSYSEQKVQISMRNRIEEFKEEFRHGTVNFYNTTDFGADLDPRSNGRPLRYVYGVVDGFKPVNIDYLRDNPTTSDNRIWSCTSETGVSDITATVVSGTTTRTTVDDVTGFRIGDHVHFDRASGTDEYLEIIDVNYGSNYVDHATLSGGAMVSSDTLRRAFIGKIVVKQGDVAYNVFPTRDYTTSTALAGGEASGFTFVNNFEANVGMPNPLSPSDTISCRVYGRQNDVTLNATALGGDDSELDILTNPVVILVDLLKLLGLPESRLDVTAFQTLVAATTDGVGIAIPEKDGSKFPMYKDLVIDIVRSTLTKLFLDNDNKWTITTFADIAGETATKDIDDLEILVSSFRYKFDYADLASEVVVEYALQELSYDNSGDTGITEQVTASSNQAKYLHVTSNQETFESLHFRSSDAQVLANKLIAILGERDGQITFQTKTRFFDTLISDIIDVSRDRLPGFDFVRGTEQSRKFSVQESGKTLRTVTVTASDQKGIEDNPGLF